MNDLITHLYKENIIQIKEIKMKNGLLSPLYLNFNNIFKNKFVLNLFLKNLHEFIENNINIEYILGSKELSKNVCTLLYFKYNYNNIFDEKNIDINIYKDLNKDNKPNILLIKENYGIDTYKNKIEKYKLNNILFLIKYNHAKNYNINTFYFLDSITILMILYQNKILNYDKYINLFNTLYLSIESYSKTLPNNFNILFSKSKIIFDSEIISKLEIKDFIKALDYISPHINIIKINLINLGNYKNHIIKLLLHHKLIIMDYFKYDINFLEEKYKENNLNSQNYLINILDINDYLSNLNSNLNINNFKLNTIINDNIKIDEFEDIRNKIINLSKSNNKIYGFITNSNKYIFENKLKIKHFISQDNLEKCFKIEKYDLLITSNIKDICSLNKLIKNII